MAKKEVSAIELLELESYLQSIHPIEGLKWINQNFGGKAKLSSAFGPEAQLITYWISQNSLDTQIFTIDTGRLFQETYDLMERTRNLLKVDIDVYYPASTEVEEHVSKKGPNSFYHSVENRLECCRIRKVNPLKRALADSRVWITGLRADQSHSRGNMRMLEWNEAYRVIKYNPLINWTAEEVSQQIEQLHIPVNKLHRLGYTSIGCQPCTRPVSEGEPERAGRWWWEESHKECGLHVNLEPQLAR